MQRGVVDGRWGVLHGWLRGEKGDAWGEVAGYAHGASECGFMGQYRRRATRVAALLRNPRRSGTLCAMDHVAILSIDWHSMLVPKLPLLDVVVRTVCIYVVLQVGMRFLGRENLQQAASYKMVTLFLVGAFGGRAVLGEDTSVTSCVLGLMVVLALNAATAYAIYHSARFAAFMEGPVVQQLIRDSAVQDDAMRATKCTMDTLYARARGRGEADLSRVKDAYMERHGEITFVLKS